MKRKSSKKSLDYVSKNVLGERNHDGKNPSKYETQKLSETIKAFWHIATPYWCTKDSLFSWLLLVLIAFFCVCSVYLSTIFNDWYREFWDSIQAYEAKVAILLICFFCIIATFHVMNVVYKSYVISALIIRWRRWLTINYLDRYLNNGTYYKIQVSDQKTDNPDQRIAEDLNQFVSLTISIVIEFATEIATLITFGIILYNLSSSVEFEAFDYKFMLPDGYLLYAGIIYALIGTALTFWIGKPLTLLNFRQQRFEADFRFSLIRLRENAESVAIYKGENEEKRRFNNLFFDVVLNYSNLISRVNKLGFFTLGYVQTAVIVPLIVGCPLYFAKVLTMGGLMQINSCFRTVQDSLSIIVTNFTSLAEWKAVIDRLSLFDESIKRGEALKSLEVKNADKITLKDVSLYRPDNTLIKDKLNLVLENGDKLLIQGHSGCGKSTLLRTIAGIWPYAKGEIAMPQDKSTLFLSQKPYMPLGTLRSLIYYPKSPEINDESNKILFDLLDKVGLSHLKERLDEVDQWSHLLSLGEQQRIAFLRVLLLKSDIVFLDEVTSALDEDNEYKLYKMLNDNLPKTTIISVGHRSTLVSLHNKHLHLD